MDLYAVLGVTKTATVDEIRSAYRKLALNLHPDRNPGDTDKERRFKDVSHAYEVLSDDGRRAKYDFERGQPARVAVVAPFFRSGRGGFTFTSQPWGTTNSAAVNLGTPIEIHVNPQMAGQSVHIQMGNAPMPGVFVFVRRRV